MDQDRRSRFFDPYYSRKAPAKSGSFWLCSTLSIFGIFGFSACLTSLYLAMRGIMRLGGFVASGGPYEIAHPAPGYVWIFPVSIMVGLACIFIHGIQAGKVGGLNLVPLAWPALFISLGWNFLEFGFRPPGGEGLAWGWLVCGVVFWLMGFIPLIVFISYFRQGFRERRFKLKLEELSATEPNGGGKAWKRVLILFQIAALILGIYCGALLMHSQMMASETPDGKNYDQLSKFLTETSPLAWML